MRLVGLCLFFISFFLCLILYATPVLAQTSSLNVRVSKSLVSPGDTYTLYVQDKNALTTPYNGLLDYELTFCPAASPTNCSVSTGKWGPTVTNGGATVTVPSNISLGVWKTRFKPASSTWDYSNQIQINVGTTYGLEDSTQYWVMPTTSVTYQGTNYTYNTPFSTVIGFLPSANLCGETGQTMYFMKDKPEGYWDPRLPWWEGIRSIDYSQKNLHWHLVNWQQKPGWYDEYLTAQGDERYLYNPLDPFNYSTNFQTKTNQYRYQFPNYFLTPKWVGGGWGHGINNALVQNASPTTLFCDITINSTNPPGTWAVHADLTTLNYPGYSGPALRYKYYEGQSGFSLDRSLLGLREDWYFVKNIGLVRIDSKSFGPTFTNSLVSRQPCLDDPDCLVNEYMTSPHVSLTRSDFLNPVKPGDLNSDGKVDIADLTQVVSDFGRAGPPAFITADINSDGKVNIFDVSIVIANFGK